MMDNAELNRRIGELGGLIQRPYTPTPLAYMMSMERNDRPVNPSSTQQARKCLSTPLWAR